MLPYFSPWRLCLGDGLFITFTTRIYSIQDQGRNIIDTQQINDMVRAPWNFSSEPPMLGNGLQNTTPGGLTFATTSDGTSSDSEFVTLTSSKQGSYIVNQDGILVQGGRGSSGSAAFLPIIPEVHVLAAESEQGTMSTRECVQTLSSSAPVPPCPPPSRPIARAKVNKEAAPVLTFHQRTSRKIIPWGAENQSQIFTLQEENDLMTYLFIPLEERPQKNRKLYPEPWINNPRLR